MNTKVISRYYEPQEQVSTYQTSRWSPDTMNLRNRSVSNEHQDDLQIPWASRTGQYLMNTKVISRYHEPQQQVSI